MEFTFTNLIMAVVAAVVLYIVFTSLSDWLLPYDKEGMCDAKSNKSKCASMSTNSSQSQRQQPNQIPRPFAVQNRKKYHKGGYSAPAASYIPDQTDTMYDNDVSLTNEDVFDEIPIDVCNLAIEEGINIHPNKEFNEVSGIDDTREKLMRKMNGKNKLKQQKYKKSRYNACKDRDNSIGAWESFFGNNNQLSNNSQKGNMVEGAHFNTFEESHYDAFANSYAPIQLDPTAKCNASDADCDPEELYNINNYFPQEVDNEFLEDVYQPISFSERTEIYSNRPLGSETIVSSNKNRTWDVRGDVACPKACPPTINVSSITPDFSAQQGLNLCGKLL